MGTYDTRGGHPLSPNMDEPMTKRERKWATRVDVPCMATTQLPSLAIGTSTFYRGSGGGRCKRRATYSDGERNYCTQHAKEPATVLRKATGKIMEGFRPIQDFA